MSGRGRPSKLRAFLDILAFHAVTACLGFLRRLGPVRASNFAASVARIIGMRLPVCRVADRNLRQAFPEMTAATRRATIAKVWDTLGRNVGELAHLAQLRETATGPGWEMVGRDNLPPGQAIFFSAHFGNWEMVLPIASQLGRAVSGFYRPASNVVMDGVIMAQRSAALEPGVTMFPKGARGARAALTHLVSGGSLGLLVDQKMNDGIAAPFFGRMAMTAPAAAQFALRFGLPLVPIRVERLGPARLRMVCEPALDVPRSGDRQADVYALTVAMNATIERWVTADPGSWLWLHKRWPKEPANPA
ncbi:lysophospholipid acyltransferase family protein [Acidisoma cladoniae]|jgi:KDO2-lipid IV(A) lauroyltransferase|uniref:lysophospholipid acyltransferase family protein n=1 Tax=Acidisoma cladoniae TaxID=3040935 RepID=UPI00254C1089|nr:lauroyl acyltransferase [Acidisoma sp. PAMC 29798]